jgi:hypothetical protein
MRPSSRYPPQPALLALALALALAAAAPELRPLAAAVTVTPPPERTDEEVRRLYEEWRSEHDAGPRRGATGGSLGPGEDDDARRLEVFRDNLRYIDAHNAEADAGLHGFRLGLTRFADLTLEEYRARLLLGSRGRNGTAVGVVGSRRYLPLAGEQLPDAVDWRERGAVAEVKDQGQCGPYVVPCCSSAFFLPPASRSQTLEQSLEVRSLK